MAIMTCTILSPIAFDPLYKFRFTSMENATDFFQFFERSHETVLLFQITLTLSFQETNLQGET